MRKFLYLITIIILAGFSTVKAATYYVSPLGDDNDNGLSEDTAWKDLASSIYRMALGDTLIVLPGDYDLHDFSAWPNDPWKGKMYLGPKGGDPNIPTTIRGKVGAPKPVIHVFDANDNPGIFRFNGCVGVHLEHLIIDHGEIGYGDYMIYKDLEIRGPGPAYGIHAEHNHAIIENCYIHDIYEGNDAIGIYITGDDNVIRNNFFKNMGQHAINSNSHGFGVEVATSKRWIIENNYITQTNGHGIGIQNVEDSIIRNNVIVNTGSQAISLGGHAFPDLNLKIVGNTIYNSPDIGNYGVFIFNNVNGLVFENNIVVHKNPVAFYSPSTHDLLAPENLATYTFRNNLYWSSLGSQKIFLPTNDQTYWLNLKEWQSFTAQKLGSSIIGIDDGSIQADPAVVSPPLDRNDYLNINGNGVDMHLKGNSPAIDAGTDSVYVCKDIEGRWRPQGGEMDIGAFEMPQISDDTQPPTAPSDLRVVNTSHDQVVLQWSASTDNVRVVGYCIYRNGQKAGISNDITFTDRYLTSKTTYQYKITAIDAVDNESPASNTLFVTTAPEPPPEISPETKFIYSWDKYDNKIPVVFDPSSSKDDGTIVEYSWDFDDGTTYVSDSPEKVLHTFPVKGYFNVTLTCTDDQGLSSSVTWPVVFYYETPSVFYVSPNGNDLNDGLSESSPLKDLSKAIYRLQQGDTLVVLPGNYELHDFKAWPSDPWKMKMYLGSKGGNKDKPVTIRGKAGAPMPVIETYDSKGNPGGRMVFAGVVGLTLEHLEIHGEVGYGDYVTYRDLYLHGPYNAYGIHGGHNHMIMENCRVEDIYGGSDAIGIYITGDDNIIRNNFFRRMGQHAINSNSYTMDGQTVPSRNWVIERNQITDTGGHGIGIQNVQDSIIRNNLIVNAKSQAISLGGHTLPDLNLKIVGNTVYNGGNDGFAGVFISNDCSGLVFQNNIIVNARPFMFLNDSLASSDKLKTMTISNNLYYNPFQGSGKIILFNNDTTRYYSLASWQSYTTGIGAPLDANSIYGDPKVISPPVSSNDYLDFAGDSHINCKLQEDSPAMDKGAEIAILQTDLDGIKRPKGSASDIGAYEYADSKEEAGSGNAPKPQIKTIKIY